MSTPGQWERAGSAFDHVRHAATEIIAAARDTLDLLDDVVSTTDLGDVMAGVNHLSQSVLAWRPHANRPSPNGASDREPGTGSPVEHISVR